MLMLKMNTAIWKMGGVLLIYVLNLILNMKSFVTFSFSDILKYFVTE